MSWQLHELVCKSFKMRTRGGEVCGCSFCTDFALKHNIKTVYVVSISSDPPVISIADFALCETREMALKIGEAGAAWSKMSWKTIHPNDKLDPMVWSTVLPRAVLSPLASEVSFM